jgi:hypothetical protein
MDASAAQLEIFPFLLSRMEKAWEPSERYANRTAIFQFNPHAIFIEAQRSRRNTHSTPFPIEGDGPRPFSGNDSAFSHPGRHCTTWTQPA